MGFFGLGQKEQQGNDARKREEKVRNLPVAEQGRLCEYALGDEDAAVRVAAATKIRDPELLQHLSRHKDPAVARIARDRLTAALVETVKGQSAAAGKDQLQQISEQSALVSITLQAEHADMRLAAFSRLCELPEVSQRTLVTAAIQEATGAFGRQIIDRIDTRGLLKDLAKKAKDAGLRDEAAKRLAQLDEEARKPSPEQRRRALAKALKPLTDRAQVLAVSERWEEAGAELAGIEAQRDALLAEAADLERDQRFDEPLAIMLRCRETFDRRRGEAAELAQVQAAHVAAKEALLADCEAAGVLDDAAREQWRGRWQEIGEAGEADPALLRRFTALLRAPGEPAPAEERSAAPVVELDPESAAKARAVIDEARALIDGDGAWRDRDFRYKELDKALRVLGLESQDPLRKEFLDAYVAFKDHRRADRENQGKQREERRKRLEILLAEAEALAGEQIEGKAVEHRRQVVKDLQSRWKEVGKVPSGALGDLRQRFRAACDAAYEPVRAKDQEREWERFAKIPLAEELIAKAKELAGHEDPAQRHEGVKDLQRDWKQLGPLPRERNDELWGAFKAACDELYEGLRPWFEERDQARVAAQATKEALLQELEQMLGAGTIGIAGSIADRESKAGREDRVKAIQAEWKAAGPAPRAVDQQLWNRYKEALDKHYQRKREEWSARDGERVDNLHRKQALCVEAEQLATDFETFQGGTPVGAKTEPDFLREVKDLQREFRQVGHVPKEQFEVIRDRFKAACDRIYQGLEGWFAAQDQEREGNYAAKAKLVEELEALLDESRPDWFKDEAKAIQGKWREIGPVPRDQIEINERFRKACDRIFNFEAPADA